MSSIYRTKRPPQAFGDPVVQLTTLAVGEDASNSFIERPERKVKDSSIDIVYRKLLEDLKQYCTEKEIEEECREYAEKKKAESTTTSGKRRGKAKR
jgi:hypothetical protein